MFALMLAAMMVFLLAVGWAVWEFRRRYFARARYVEQRTRAALGMGERNVTAIEQQVGALRAALDELGGERGERYGNVPRRK